jgi:Predicted permeases
MYFFTVFNQVSVLFLLMGVGYALARLGIIDDAGTAQMSTVLCYVVAPVLIVFAFQTRFSSSMLHNLLIVAAATAGALLLNIFAGLLAFNKKFIPNNDQRSILQFASAYSNCGFMGFPLLQALAGPTGLFYGSAVNGVFNLFSWTHGMTIYSGKLSKKSAVKAIVNPNVLAVFVGAALFCLSITLPGPIYTTVKYISQLNTPLSMIIIGTTITKVPFRSIFTEKLVWLGVVMRNIVLPFLLLFILYAVGLRGDILLCSLIPMACPVAGVTVIFANLTGKSPVFPSRLMTLSTLASIVTLPLVITAALAL